jgi:hypothetical protein
MASRLIRNQSESLKTPGNTAISEAAAAPRAAVDSDLARVIAAWPGLPAAIKRGILAMVQ